MRRWSLLVAAAIIMSASFGMARQASTAGPYKILKTAKEGGAGGLQRVHS